MLADQPVCRGRLCKWRQNTYNPCCVSESRKTRAGAEWQGPHSNSEGPEPWANAIAVGGESKVHVKYSFGKVNSFFLLKHERKKRNKRNSIICQNCLFKIYFYILSLHILLVYQLWREIWRQSYSDSKRKAYFFIYLTPICPAVKKVPCINKITRSWPACLFVCSKTIG